MKKYFLLLLITFFGFYLIGCSKDSGTTNDDDDKIEIPDENPDDKPNDDPDDKPIDEKPSIDFTFNYNMHEIFEKVNPYTQDTEFFIYIGYYPQSEITNPAVIKELQKITETNERGYLEYDNHEIAKVTVVNNHIYGEEPSSDETFYYATQYRVGTTHYFLVEPICWRILNDPISNELFLITEDIIDSRHFNTFDATYTDENDTLIRPSDFEHSDIRKWLNDYFYNNAFTPIEHAFIQESYNVNDPTYNFPEPNKLKPTIDKVFLLSYNEVIKFNYGFYNQECRMAKASDFSRAKGLLSISNDISKSSNWWIRTGFEFTPYFPAMVKYDGTADKNYYPMGDNIGVRPAIKVVLE